VLLVKALLEILVTPGTLAVRAIQGQAVVGDQVAHFQSHQHLIQGHPAAQGAEERLEVQFQLLGQLEQLEIPDQRGLLETQEILAHLLLL